jgi:hypothetical protein
MNPISRRRFFGIGLGAAAFAGASPLPVITRAKAATALAPNAATAFLESIENAIAFQTFMMDAYAAGNTVRLSQSYADQSGLLSTA